MERRLPLAKTKVSSLESSDSHLPALLDALRDINTEGELAPLLQRIVERAVAVIPGAERATLLLREGEELVCRAAVGWGSGHCPPVPVPKDPPAEARPCWRQPGTIRMGESPEPPGEVCAVCALMNPDTIPAALTAPLFAKGEYLGCLHLENSHDQHAFDSVSPELVLAFAEQVSLSIRHAWLYQERQHAHQREQKRRQALAALYTVASMVNRSLNLTEVLTATLDTVMQLFRVEFGEVLLLDGASGDLYAAAQRGVAPVGAPGQPSMRLGEGIPGQVVASGKPIQVPDVLADPRFVRSAEARALGYRSMLAIPLRAQERTVGTLDLLSRSPQAYSPDDLQALLSIGEQIGTAIEHIQHYQELRAQKAELAQYASRITQAQEDERQRVARDLHDDTVQRLIVLSRGLDECQEQLPRSPRSAVNTLERLRRELGEIIVSVRRFSRDLRPAVLDDLGLVPALDLLVNEYNTGNKGQATLLVGSNTRRLAPEAELALFRIAQEALTNVGKHAQASEVKVTLELGDGEVHLMVADNGQGFDPAHRRPGPVAGTQVGLAGMRERASLIGGTLEVLSRPGEGTKIVAHVPVREPGVA
ncbi:MAG: GAF domain-containing sensor histidine kinase [Deinococcus sp.]|nr:GAF domain-containing sensor histidine kinase [Deinococcus sp.]